jgi:hypothetical protein
MSSLNTISGADICINHHTSASSSIIIIKITLPNNNVQYSSNSTSTSMDTLTQFTNHIVDNDYIYHYKDTKIDFKESRISSTQFLEAYTFFCEQNGISINNMRSLRDIRDNKQNLPNNLYITRARGCTTDILFFKDITPSRRTKNKTGD